LTRRLVLRPRTGWQPLELREIWNYRDLFWMLAARDIKIRYKQTVLGIAWAVIQPLFTMLIFTMIARFGNIPTDGVAPPIFYYAGMLPWFLFANAVTSAGNSLLASQHLISKVYFPRLIAPIAAVITALVDFLIGFALLLAMMAFYGVHPGPQIVALPLVVALAFLAALAFGFWLCALSVQYRDVRHVMPFAIQFWLFCTPVLYPSSVVHSPWKRALLGINPMSGIVDAFRWCVLGRPMPGPVLLVSAAMIAVVLVGSLYYFRRVEKTLVDRL
jgi:lipopolysaccharide transport system permease protein